MELRIDAEKCTGHGRCYTLAPDLFHADEEGHSVLVRPGVAVGLEDQARLALGNCPERAIRLID
jgi:ferredoxin